ncbi:restriction endonuclease subunit S [Cardiobacterium hominis]|uniref:restriction endonuclease subunit S n=1 Tax=Cardiobacterium hominis TaxID=2718 RepID=UPI0028D01BF5|nr:restriction endonuclease subunit S [Cardiobacterium hominis]
MRTPQLADNLRRAVLQAAIEGKLNDRTSEDARDLLAAIQREKTAQQKTGKQKKSKPLAAINEEEIPFAIPDNWVWVRLSDLCYSIPSKPYQILQKETQMTGLYPVVSQSKNTIDGYSDKKEKLFSNIPIIVFGDHTRVIKLIDFEFIVGADGTKLLKPILANEKYVEFALKALTINMVDRGYSRHFQFIKDLPIPLPPLTEQQQIVAKLNRLLTEIDELKTQEQSLLAAQNAFPKKLRAALLQAAVQGELNERTNENARDLLAAIQAEKTALQKTGKLKKDKPLAAIKEEEIPFAIPENWVWVRLGEIGIWGSGATPNRSNPDFYRNGDINWLKTGDLNDGYIDETSEKITALAVEKSSVILQPIGTVLMAMYGATIGKLGILNIPATTNQACCACVPFKGVLNKYLFYFLLFNRSNFILMGAGGAQPNISKEKIVSTLIPLPPLSEQQQIVAKLEALLAEIDTLENAT